MKSKSDMKHFTRGGQIFLHNFRMTLQVIKKVGFIGLGMLMVMNVAWFYLSNSEYERYVAQEVVFAKIQFFMDEGSTQPFRHPNGEVSEVLVKQILQSKPIMKMSATVCRRVI